MAVLDRSFENFRWSVATSPRRPFTFSPRQPLTLSSPKAEVKKIWWRLSLWRSIPAMVATTALLSMINVAKQSSLSMFSFGERFSQSLEIDGHCKQFQNATLRWWAQQLVIHIRVRINRNTFSAICFPLLTCTHDIVWLYHLVISHSHGKSPVLIGKPWVYRLPSISMGHLYHGYVSHNQRVIHTPIAFTLRVFWPVM